MHPALLFSLLGLLLGVALLTFHLLQSRRRVDREAASQIQLSQKETQKWE